jgi:hypothetical protein
MRCLPSKKASSTLNFSHPARAKVVILCEVAGSRAEFRDYARNNERSVDSCNSVALWIKPAKTTLLLHHQVVLRNTH